MQKTLNIALSKEQMYVWNTIVDRWVALSEGKPTSPFDGRVNHPFYSNDELQFNLGRGQGHTHIAKSLKIAFGDGVLVVVPNKQIHRSQYNGFKNVVTFDQSRTVQGEDKVDILVFDNWSLTEHWYDRDELGEHYNRIYPSVRPKLIVKLG